ncbi:hypothetical protein McanMca71_003858 [Microsporum canis]
MQYDKESGQVYSEEVIRVAPSARKLRGFAWVHESPFLPRGWEAHSPVGAHSLKHMAMRAVLADQRSLTSMHFKGVPWSIAEYLWGCIRRSKRTSLYLWKIFAETYPTKFNQIAPRYLLKLSSQQMPVSNYLKLLSSKTLSWLAIVSISTEFFEPHEFLEIANVPNIFGLEIRSWPILTDNGYTSPATISDRIVRGWSEMALAGRAFGQLRILVLRLQSAMTEHMFTYLEAFPLLRVFIMQACPRLYSKEARELAEQHGWESTTVNYPDSSLYRIIMNMESDLRASSEGSSFMLHTSPVVEFSLLRRNLMSLDSEDQILFRKKLRRRGSHLVPQKDVTGNQQIVRAGEPAKPKKKEKKPVVKENRKKEVEDLLAEFKYASLPLFAASPED